MEQSIKIDWNDCHYFSVVADQGSFAAASKVLDVPTSTLSRRINALESVLAVRLIQRSTRRLHLTEAAKFFSNTPAPCASKWSWPARRSRCGRPARAARSN